MRIWSLHPKYLDTKGLLALWRETLLAKSVLMGQTRAYLNHSQLTRFKQLDHPVNAINAYLAEVWTESESRGYIFDKKKVDWNFKSIKINVNSGQVNYEVAHLLKKLEIRDQLKFSQLKITENAEVHPLFEIVTGGIEPWEKIRQ